MPNIDFNARIETDKDIVKRFIESSIYWNRFSNNNEVVIGTAGSGKTILLKMMSFKLLKEFSFNNISAKSIIDSKKFIGIYIPMKIFAEDDTELDDISNKHRNDFFIRSFNFHACISFLDTIESCVSYYFTNNDILKDIAKYLSDLWFDDNSNIECFEDIRDFITKDWLALQDEIRSLYFGEKRKLKYNMKRMDFFSPIQLTINKVSKFLNFNDDTTFVILLDEGEFLSDYQKKQINTLMRSSQRPFVFKFATMPFSNTKLETIKKGQPLRPNQDFSYIPLDYINNDENNNEYKSFATKLLLERLKEDFILEDKKLEEIFGQRKNQYENPTLEIIKDLDADTLSKKFFDSLSPAMKKLAAKEVEESGTSNKVTNKFFAVYCTKLVRNHYKSIAHSKPKWFYGIDTILKISDGNIRRLLKIIYLILNDLPRGSSIKNVSGEKQHKAIVDFATEEIELNRSLISDKGYELFIQILNRLNNSFHERENPRTATSFLIDRTTIKTNEEELKKLIWYGRLIPQNYEGELLRNIGPKWRLSYLFAIPFWLILRIGTPLDLNAKPNIKKKNNDLQLELEGM